MGPWTCTACKRNVCICANDATCTELREKLAANRKTLLREYALMMDPFWRRTCCKWLAVCGKTYTKLIDKRAVQCFCMFLVIVTMQACRCSLPEMRRKIKRVALTSWRQSVCRGIRIIKVTKLHLKKSNKDWQLQQNLGVLFCAFYLYYILFFFSNGIWTVSFFFSSLHF